MNIKIVSHFQSWVNSIVSSHKNSFDVLSIKQKKIETRIKEMLTIIDVSACYERYKEDAYKLSTIVCIDKNSKIEIQSEKRNLDKKIRKEKKSVIRKRTELNKLLDRQAELEKKIKETKEVKAKNALKKLCERMANKQEFIESEGIFRKSPKKTDEDKYENKIDNLLADIEENNISDMNVVAHAIKAQLKDSLTTSDYQIIARCIEKFNTVDNVDVQQQDLPTSIVDVIELCKKITDEPANKMDAKSLGIVIGPNIVPETTRDPSYYLKCNAFFQKLIEQREIA